MSGGVLGCSQQRTVSVMIMILQSMNADQVQAHLLMSQFEKKKEAAHTETSPSSQICATLLPLDDEEEVALRRAKL